MQHSNSKDARELVSWLNYYNLKARSFEDKIRIPAAELVARAFEDDNNNSNSKSKDK